MRRAPRTLPLFPEESLPPPDAPASGKAPPRPVQAVGHPASPDLLASPPTLPKALWLAVQLSAASHTAPAAARPLLERLATRLGAFSPRISLVEPDGLVLEIGASLRLFGGYTALREAVTAVLAETGESLRLACAPTPLAATWLARADGDDVLEIGQLAGRLGELPVTVWRGDAASLALLRELGARRLADCLRLPRDALARRCGVALVQALARALGQRPDPRAAWVPRRGWRETCELPAETELHAQLLEALAGLLDRLSHALRTRDAAVQRLRLELFHLARPASSVVLELLQPSRDAAHLHELYARRLEQTALPAPVIALALVAPRLEHDVMPAAAGLFTPGTGPAACEGVPQLVERLRARLGVSAVHGLCLVPEHRPEAAWQPVAAPGQGVRDAPLPPAAVRRPVWMLAEPVALESHAGHPWHHGRLAIEQGPERIETGWWDGGDVARDYYIARDRAGVRLWVYRERLGARRWWLHGVFG